MSHRRAQRRNRWDREAGDAVIAQRRGAVRVRDAGLHVSFREDADGNGQVRITPLGKYGDIGIVFNAEHLAGLIVGLRELQRQIEGKEQAS